jgi:hypothetical protein
MPMTEELVTRKLKNTMPEIPGGQVHAQRGSVAIIHGNGFHKGPSWNTYGSPNNKVRTALRLISTGTKQELV